MSNTTTALPVLSPRIPPLTVGKYTFHSRLLVGTGKYPDMVSMQFALKESGCDVVTVAVRRANLTDQGTGKSLLDYIGPEYQLLPNTAGCFTAEDALRTARLGRELGISDMIKLEVLADQQTLLPHPTQTLEATRILAAEGFTVLVYTSDDPVLALELESAGGLVAADRSPAAAGARDAGGPPAEGLGGVRLLRSHVQLCRQRLSRGAPGQRAGVEGQVGPIQASRSASPRTAHSSEVMA